MNVLGARQFAPISVAPQRAIPAVPGLNPWHPHTWDPSRQDGRSAWGVLWRSPDDLVLMYQMTVRRLGWLNA